MPHVTFIYPSVGRTPGAEYIRSWQMQPLAIAVLSSLTPANWEKSFFDDRLEEIDYAVKTDLVAISIETFTARRGYQIAAEYRRRGVAVVMGGYHATFCPDEVLEHADGVCIGDAEGVWANILRDAAGKKVSGKYQAGTVAELTGVSPDRSIFNGKNYFKIALVETSRGCPNTCHFCSITAFHKGRYRSRPIGDVVQEIGGLRDKTLFFVDDNIAGDPSRAKEFFRAILPLNIAWIGQASVRVAADEQLLDLIAASGCVGLLIGFESLSTENLKNIGKNINRVDDFSGALGAIRKRGIAIYGTFMFGLPHDSKELLDKTVAFARKERIFLAAFNHVVPFPGTPFYHTLTRSNQLPIEQWWLDPDYRFGQSPFRPECTSAQELEEWCFQARKSFYSLPSIMMRAGNLSSNCNTVRKALLFLSLNFLMLHEITKKRGIPLGFPDEDVPHASYQN